MFWLISCTSWKPSAIMVLRILLLIVASVAEDDEACITNSVLTTKTCWRYDCGCSAAPDVRPIFLAICCRLDYVSATHGQRHGQRAASGMLAWQTEFASQLPRSSRTHLLISHSRSLHNFQGINWRRRMKASRLLLSTSPDLSFKNQCRSLSVLPCLVAAASKEMYKPVINVSERLGEDGWCTFGGIGTWASNCAIARHMRDSMIFVKTLLSWSSWSSSQFTLSIFFHHKLFQVCFTLFACDFLSLVANVIFVDLSSEVWRGIQRIYEWAAGNAFCTSLSWQSHSNHPWSWLPLGWCLLLSEWMVRLASSWTRQQLFLPWRGVRSLLWSLGKDLSWILEHHHGRFVSRVRIRWSIFAWHPEERCRCRICNSVIGRWHVSACSSQMLNARTAASLGCIILSILSSKVIILWGKVVKSTVFVYKQQYVQDIRKPLEVGRHLL